MNTKQVLKIVDSLAAKKGVSRQQIIDSILYSGTIQFDNLNDRINMANRVCPNFTSEQVDNIFNSLQNALFDAGYPNPDNLVLSYVLTDTPPKDAIYIEPIGSLQLAFVLEEA